MAGNRKNTVLCLTLLGAFLTSGSIAKAAPYTLETLNRMLKAAQQQLASEQADLGALEQVIEAQSHYVDKLRTLGFTTSNSDVVRLLRNAEAELAKMIRKGREIKQRILEIQAQIAWIMQEIENFENPDDADPSGG